VSVSLSPSVSSDAVLCLLETDLDFRIRLIRIGVSMPRRKESATMTLRPPESGEKRGPGIIRDMEWRTGVYGLTGSACGIAGLC